MKPEAVIFDVGNVLTSWVPEVHYDRVLGRAARERLFAEVDLHAMNDLIDRGAPFRDTVEAWAQAHPDHAQGIRMWFTDWQHLASPRIEGSIRLQRALRAKGVPVFVLSNFGTHYHDESVTGMDFLADFDRFYVSGVLGVAKPDPRIYEIVEQDSGIPPDRLIFADDRADNITAAARRGWRTHQFESWQGWARRLVAEDLLTKEEAGL